MKVLNSYLRVNKVTKRALAARMGVSESAIGHWCTGRKAPSRARIKKLSRVTGISLERLL